MPLGRLGGGVWLPRCVPQVRCRPALAPVHQEEGRPFGMGLLVCWRALTVPCMGRVVSGSPCCREQACRGREPGLGLDQPCWGAPRGGVKVGEGAGAWKWELVLRREVQGLASM